MNGKELKEFLCAQIALMKRAKRRLEKQHDAVFNDSIFFNAWIQEYSQDFRTKWNLSSCKTCQQNCKYLTRIKCKYYLKQ